MKALVYHGDKTVSLIDTPLPQVKDDEVLLRVCCSALCGSERHDFEHMDVPDQDFVGTPPLNTGHEFTGVIEDPNGSLKWKKGDRVTVHVTCGCGECYYCKQGMQQFCKDMKMVFNGHAEYVAVPERACIALPDDMSQEEAVLLAADTIGVAWRAAKRINGEKGSWVLVTGAGPIGLGVVLLLKFLGYRVAVSELSAYRQDYAKKLGADLIINPVKEDLKAILEDNTDGLGVANIIECSGNGMVELSALDLVRCNGTVVFAGENAGTIPISPSGHFTRKEMTLTGVWYQSDQDFAEITQLFRDGLDVLPLISHTIAPEELPVIGPKFFGGETAKVVIKWSEE